MDTDLIKKINTAAPYLSEVELDEWVVPAFESFYTTKINSLAYRAYGAAGSVPQVARLAFRERSKAELRAALYTFLFKAEHWKSGRDINTYLLTSLNRLADRIAWDKDSIKKVSLAICPACKFLNRKEFLLQEGKFWRCQQCTDEHIRLEQEIKDIKSKSNNDKLLFVLEPRYNLCRLFSLHSKIGYRCPDCYRFIPESISGIFGVSCPYNDCSFFGKIDNLSKMAHPSGLAGRIDLSLQEEIYKDAGSARISSGRSRGKEFQEKILSRDINPDVEMEIKESFQKDLEILTSVLDDQVSLIKRVNSQSTMMQKLLMYEAYQSLLKKYPEEMISYLVHRKQNSEFPIQARIFQEYASLMQEALPYSISYGNSVYDVVSLTDPNIQLFSGISEYDAFVRSDHTIPNNTVETYIGGRKFKCYGPCFIGMLIDVVDVKKELSIKDKVDRYGFVQIKMRPEVVVGTKVHVKHFRIPSHYELGALVFLQRIRRRIVDSTFFRIHGKKRDKNERH